MLHLIYEGTPVGTIPVQPFNAGTPRYWEAGAVGMLDANGYGVVSDGTVAFGILADRRNTTVGISIVNFLPSNAGGYGDETPFNQPGHGNGLFGTSTNGNGVTVNNIIPANTVPTTTLLRDETFANPNSDSRFITMYNRGGMYATDQFDGSKTYTAGDKLYVMTDNSGRLTNDATVNGGSPVLVGHVVKTADGNGFLTFQSALL